MKSAFKFDPEFPVIDAIGHSDKIGYLNVKGGGSTNTTLFEPSSVSSHYMSSWRTRSAVSPPTSADNFTPCAVDPTQSEPGNFNPGALNVISEGDGVYSRCSDSVRLNRIIVSGSVTRAGGHAFYANSFADAAVVRVKSGAIRIAIKNQSHKTLRVRYQKSRRIIRNAANSSISERISVIRMTTGPGDRTRHNNAVQSNAIRAS